MIIMSAPDSLKASTPCWMFSIVGFGLISLYSVYGMSFSSRRFVTLAVTPNFTRSGSDATKAFLKPLALIRPGISLIAPWPWYLIDYILHVLIQEKKYSILLKKWRILIIQYRICGVSAAVGICVPCRYRLMFLGRCCVLTEGLSIRGNTPV